MDCEGRVHNSIHSDPSTNAKCSVLAQAEEDGEYAKYRCIRCEGKHKEASKVDTEVAGSLLSLAKPAPEDGAAAPPPKKWRSENSERLADAVLKLTEQLVPWDGKRNIFWRKNSYTCAKADRKNWQDQPEVMAQIEETYFEIFGNGGEPKEQSSISVMALQPRLDCHVDESSTILAEHFMLVFAVVCSFKLYPNVKALYNIIYIQL